MSRQVSFGDFNQEELKRVSKTSPAHISFRFRNSADLVGDADTPNGDGGGLRPLMKDVDLSKVLMSSRLSASATPFRPASAVLNCAAQPSSTSEPTAVTTTAASTSTLTRTAEVRTTQDAAAGMESSPIPTVPEAIISLQDISFQSDSSMGMESPSPAHKSGKVDFLYEISNDRPKRKELLRNRITSPTKRDSKIATPQQTAECSNGTENNARVNTMQASSVPMAGNTVQVSSSSSSSTSVSADSSQVPSSTPEPPATTLSSSSALLTSNLSSVQTMTTDFHAVNTLSSSYPVASCVATVWNKAKDWGDVFKQSAAARQSTHGEVKDALPSHVAQPSSQAEGLKLQQQHSNSDVNVILLDLGEKLKSMTVDYTSSAQLVPRGLINQANLCYMHCTLQMLLACPPFVNLMRSFNPDPPLTTLPSPTLTIDAMVRFMYEFQTMQEHQEAGAKKKKKSRVQDFPKGTAIKPEYVHSVFEKKSTCPPATRLRGRQEDAEEFLGVILDSLHEEMVSALFSTTEGSPADPSSDNMSPQDSCHELSPEDPQPGVEGEEEEWEQVGFNNRSMVTRQTSFRESPISEIFRGEVLSIVTKQGSKGSATVQPFFALPLDIQSEGIKSVEQALERHGAKESISDMKCSRTNAQVEASRKVCLSRLPPILILHLKRFSFGEKGSQKLSKLVDYHMELEISRDWLAPMLRKCPAEQRKYHLAAVVYHHGVSSTGGHYTCDVHLPQCGGWINANDHTLTSITEEGVLKAQDQSVNKVAYLLCYRRAASLA